MKTYAILCSGPSMSAEVAEAVRAAADVVIAVNHTHRIAPWADVLVALDRPWPAEFEAFAGEKICPHPGAFVEQVALTPSHTVHIRNSGLAAIRIAAQRGATRIILAGFEPETKTCWHDDEIDTGKYVGVRAGLEQIKAELAGVTIEHWTHPTEAPKSIRKWGKRG